MDPSLVRASKFLSLILRHDPGRVGLSLDPAGWADVDELLAAAARAGVRMDRPLLERVIADNDKQRFALSPGGTRIRANQGHSFEVDLGLEPRSPPEVLFHGTASRHLDSIRREGLRPGRRTHVHLSADAETARAVGARHGHPVVLEVAAAEMQRSGHDFLCSRNGVWLTRTVPAAFLRFPD